MADKFGRFLHDRRQIVIGRFYWQTKLANFSFPLKALKILCFRFPSVPKKPASLKFFIGVSEIFFAVFSLLPKFYRKKTVLYLGALSFL